MLNPCSLCSAECCKDHYITVTIFDIVRIAKKTGRKPEEFAEIYALRLINFDNETVLETQEGECILCLKSHPCIFLRNKKCTIYEFAPSVCRTYPKQINGKFNFRLCPFPSSVLFRICGTNMPENYADELKEYKRMVAEWNKKKGKKKDCVDFLLKQL